MIVLWKTLDTKPQSYKFVNSTQFRDAIKKTNYLDRDIVPTIGRGVAHFPYKKKITSEISISLLLVGGLEKKKYIANSVLLLKKWDDLATKFLPPKSDILFLKYSLISSSY